MGKNRTVGRSQKATSGRSGKRQVSNEGLRNLAQRGASAQLIRAARRAQS
jgi:hypothetical protein